MIMQSKPKQRIYLSDLEQKLRSTLSFEEACQILQELLVGPFSANERGEFYEIKGLVALTDGVKMSINSKEHAPPHFHVTYGREEGLFSIVDCNLIKGRLSPRTRNVVYGWWKSNKALLIEKWDDSRPSDCSVGVYKE